MTEAEDIERQIALLHQERDRIFAALRPLRARLKEIRKQERENHNPYASRFEKARPRYLAAFEMRCQQKTYREIGEAMGVCAQRASELVGRGRRMLRHSANAELRAEFESRHGAGCLA